MVGYKNKSYIKKQCRKKIREDDILLKSLLKDQTTGKNIKWATNSYIANGPDFLPDKEIKNNLVTGWYADFISSRSKKNSSVQLKRQRNKGEVFTPSWIVRLQVEAALASMGDLELGEFIQIKWMEITCGEAPYMTNRYDMITGETIPIQERSGFIDYKFRKLNNEVNSEDRWIKLAEDIYKASYGYEYQGDSLFIARENLLLTFLDNYHFKFNRIPNNKLVLKIAKIISFNVFQMDGLTYEIPYSIKDELDNNIQMSLFDDIEPKVNNTPKPTKLKFWEQNNVIYYKELMERMNSNMKFDVVIGNPPYQLEDGGAQSSAKPIYNHFVETGKQIASEYLSLIIPTRWFVGGKGLDLFRKNMLNDPHIKELHDFINPNDVFPNTNIRGGVCYFIWDANYDYSNQTRFVTYKNGEIINDINRPLKVENADILIRDALAPKIIEKIQNYRNYKSLESIVSSLRPFGFRGYFTKDERFHSTSEDLNEPVTIYGRGMKKGYIERDIISKNTELIDRWKLFTPRANNIGTELTDDNLNIHIMPPETICTESYIVIGADLDLNKESIINLKKYLQTKFARYLHGVAKASHDASAKTYRFIPIQDFTQESDIDWSESNLGISQQLYNKYNLSDEEIIYIENNIKGME